MGFVSVPINSLGSPAKKRPAAIGPAGEGEVPMTNPHPQPAQPIPIPERNPASDSLLLEELRVLRERGLTDECIHGLFSGFHIDAHTEPSGQHWSLPTNDELIRLIWGKALPTPIHLD